MPAYLPRLVALFLFLCEWSLSTTVDTLFGSARSASELNGRVSSVFVAPQRRRQAEKKSRTALSGWAPPRPHFEGSKAARLVFGRQLLVKSLWQGLPCLRSSATSVSFLHDGKLDVAVLTKVDVCCLRTSLRHLGQCVSIDTANFVAKDGVHEFCIVFSLSFKRTQTSDYMCVAVCITLIAFR